MEIRLGQFKIGIYFDKSKPEYECLVETEITIIHFGKEINITHRKAISSNKTLAEVRLEMLEDFKEQIVKNLI